MVGGHRLPAQQTQWEPHAAGIAGCGVAGVLMAIAGVTVVTDPPGRALTGIAAVGLIVFAGASWRARPKLAITPDGLALRGWFGTQLFQPSDIKIIRITEFRRYARKVRLLEVESVHGALIVFTRSDLGTEPLEVLDAL